jgi:hypothetical protein
MIHDKDTTLQWIYDYQANGSVDNNNENLAKSIMKNTSKKFLYKKSSRKIFQ